MVQRGKDLALSPQRLGLLLWHVLDGFDPWPGNLHLLLAPSETRTKGNLAASETLCVVLVPVPSGSPLEVYNIQNLPVGLHPPRLGWM